MRRFLPFEETEGASPCRRAALVFVSGLALLIGACASERVATTAYAPGSAPATSVTATASLHALARRGNEEMVCRDVEVTGTRFAKQVCKPANEWSDLRRQQQAEAREYMRQTIENGNLIESVPQTEPGARLY